MDTKTLLNDTPENLIRRYKTVLTDNGIPVKRMILFGSYARGTAKPWSDIDVCVVSPKFGKKPFSEMVRLAKLTISVNTMIEPHPYNPKDLTDKWDPLAAEIRRYGKTIV
ncbi:hypothetical protein A3A79_03145 [Candidatus Gottesmanbacteria bacterium RIFCSPLOWO2_01_FULL_43_11b]|uniref:Polymerase nucleotidyl transferase domain-containing protein n=1 Tax=Candidatus Gottesmanbacteria bacterium RIFCSPLOWO2_01_FULL_43_11b TaxID=1798392 RepID=A0A1F6AI64_9BACT|nr:MAG: hypothetical protein A3A79_03145 [Candidatus Gottesmanbacteria bacterium RIFCSPLOWO2_01_FULL_43_11b]